MSSSPLMHVFFLSFKLYFSDWHNYHNTESTNSTSTRPSLPNPSINIFDARSDTLDLPIGCYKDDRAEKSLYGAFMESNELSTNLCIRYCRSMSYEFAGLQAGNKLVGLTMS